MNSKRLIQPGSTQLIAFLLIIVGLSYTPAAGRQTSENTEFLYAKRLYDDKMYELAAQQFRDFVVNYPSSPRGPEALFQAGEAFFKAKLYEKARQSYFELTMRFSKAAKNDEAQFRSGDCFKAMFKYNEAAKAYHRVKVFFPKSHFASTGLIEAGRMYWRDGNYSQALNMFFDFINVYPDDSRLIQVRLDVVVLLTEKGELQRALSEADKLISLAYRGKIKNQAVYQKGRIFAEMGRLDEAQQAYLSLTKQSTTNDLQAKVNIRLGYIYRLKGEWEGSNKYFLKAVKAKGEVGTQMETYLMLGDNYFDLNQTARALENYRKVLAQTTESGTQSQASHYFEAIFKIALCHKALADYDNSNDNYLRFLKEYTPINRKVADYREQCFLHIAQNHLLLGDGFSAISYFRKYLELFPESNLNDQLQFKIAQVYERNLKNYDKAIQMYDHFMEVYPQSPYIDDAQLGLAQSYEADENYDRALKTYQNFLISYPGGVKYNWVERQVQKLQDYYLKDLQGGISTLSQLFGAYLTDESTTTVLLKLANLNYEQLKDYRQALSYYQKSLNLSAADMSNDEIYYRMAQCYLKLANFSATPQDELAQPALVDSARRLFRLVTASYVDGKWVDDAAIALAEIPGSSSTASDYLNMLNQFPLSPRKDYILLKLGNTLVDGRHGNATGSFQSAANYYQQLLTKYPDSPYSCQAHFNKGRYLFQINDHNGAKQAFESYLDHCPQQGSTVQAYFYLATIMQQQRNYEQSLANLQSIVTNYFYSSYADSAYLMIGDILLEKGDYQAALDHLLKIEQQFNKVSWSSFDKVRAEMFSQDELVFKIARAYEKLADYTNAKLRYQNYLKLVPNGPHVPQVLLALGQITAAEGSQDSEIALSYLERLKRESSDKQINYSASIQAADLLFQEGKYTEARVEFQRTVQMAATKADKEKPQAQAIVCMFRMGQISVAEKEVANFSQEFGNIPKYMAKFEYEKGKHYLKAKSHDRAEDIFSKLRRKYKQTEYAPRAELELGQLYFNTNKDEKAMDIITRIPEKYPDSEVAALAYIYLGDYYVKRAEQPSNAVSLYKKALAHPKIGRHNDYATQNLIDCYEILREYDLVLLLLREQIKKYPNNASNFDRKIKIGSTYMALRQYDLAIAQFQELNKIAGAEYEGEVQYFLAQCYEEMGQYERAITEYLKVKYVSKQTKDLPWDVSAQYRASECYQKIKRYDEAINLLEKIVLNQGIQSNFGRKASLQIEEIKRKKAQEQN